MPARSPIAIDATFMLLGSVEYPAFTSAAHVSGSTPSVVPHKNASQSLNPLLYTRPGFDALLGLIWPAPWRKIRFASEVASSTSYPEVISADLIIIGDQDGWRCIRSAATPATCGADMDVPLYKLKSSPGLPGGATEARMSWPGAITSGFNRSPPPAVNGPRDEKAAVNGAGSLKVNVDWLILAVPPGVPA